MLLFEVTDNPIIIKLIAVTDQLKSDVDDKTLKNDISIERFIKYLSDHDIPIDKDDLYDMIKTAPLNKVISNIENGKIIFKGKKKEKLKQPEDKDKKIVKQMAKSAQKPE